MIASGIISIRVEVVPRRIGIPTTSDTHNGMLSPDFHQFLKKIIARENI
jgi:hypothetical protein